MQVVFTIDAARSAVAKLRRQNQSIGFVPTMGALHVGHRALIDASNADCDATTVSIFVNPTQFGPNEDYERYPRPLEDDLAMCRDAGVELVFNPTAGEMYPDGGLTTIHVAGLTERLCGAQRPGHFDAVTTVVAKLCNIIMPDKAYFGEKDYQQLKAVEQMVRDLNMPLSIMPCPTVREDDGLAVSSRNAYLTPAQRQQASSLSAALRSAAKSIATGRRDASKLIPEIERGILASGPAAIDYVSIVDAETLAPLATVDRPSRICVAVRIGACRLIDNVAVDASGVGD